MTTANHRHREPTHRLAAGGAGAGGGWRRAAEIATRAAELTEDQVDTYLDRECDTMDLRREVQALLTARPMTSGAPRLHRPQSPPGRRIGPYTLMRSLGVGGMGEVYLARQEQPIEREVAIKLIHPAVGALASHRFELERRAVARLRHPFIAQVYEAGTTEEGQPFLAMELVEGAVLDRYCDGRRLSLEDRLRLFCSVCDGIHHAHQKGLLHRDIKPDNVLVSEFGGDAVPKIIDFGIAKDLDQDGEEDSRFKTRTGAVMGTPAYVSPEAILGTGGLDIRSDVYSLGILLFELLVGRVPFDGESGSWLELIQRASSEQTPSPSSLFAGLPAVPRREIAAARSLGDAALRRRVYGDLDAIAQKATARDRETRYGSASELAADVRRYLGNRPIQARRASRWYAAAKFARRHRAGVLAAVLALLSLTGGLVARTFEARRADRAAAVATKAQEDTRRVVEFLVGLFEVSDPGNSLGATVTARQLLDQAALRVDNELQDQPLARARLLDTIGVVYGNLGLYPEASEMLEQSLAARRELGGPLDIAESLLHLGRLRLEQSDTEAARELVESSLELRRAELPAGHPLVAESLDELGQVLQGAARFPEARAKLEEALEIREAHFGRDSEPVTETLNHLALVAQGEGDYPAAEEILGQLLTSRERLYGPEHPEVARTLNALANSLERQGRDAEAEALLRRSLHIRERVFGPVHAEVGQSLTNLANSLRDQDRPREALVYIRRSLSVLEKVHGGEHSQIAIALHNLGDFYVEQGDLERAEDLLRRALDMFVKVRGADHPMTAYPAKRLADVLRDTGRLAEAEALYRQAFEVRFASLPKGNSQIGDTARDLADLLRRRDKVDEAMRLEASYPEPPDES